MATDRREVDPESPVYQEFVRLYRIARTFRPTRHPDQWNGELHGRSDDIWGSVHPRSGAVSLNERNVLPYLTGRPSAELSGHQARALQTVLHEAYHQRVPTDATSPNAYRGHESMALDEGLTEYQASQDVEFFAEQAGYGRLASDGNVYPGPVTATTQLLDYAVGPGKGRNDLASRALDQPVVMRWDTIADEIVRTRLSTVVPSDPRHQQAARAVLVEAMAHPTWRGLQDHNEVAGHIAAHHTRAALDTAVDRLHQHYRTVPAQPSPTTTSTPPVADTDIERTRSAPPPATDPALRAAFSGQAPAGLATHTVPSLGNGARRRSTLHAREITATTGRDSH